MTLALAPGMAYWRSPYVGNTLCAFVLSALHTTVPSKPLSQIPPPLLWELLRKLEAFKLSAPSEAEVERALGVGGYYCAVVICLEVKPSSLEL